MNQTKSTDDTAALLAARAATHGDFRECAGVSQQILRTLSMGSRWRDLSDVHRESLQMIAHKLHRIVCGDPMVADHWDDLAGYAKLVSRYVNEERERAVVATAASTKRRRK